HRGNGGRAMTMGARGRGSRAALVAVALFLLCVAGLVSLRIESRILGRILGACPARAAETLRFRSVPPESETMVERRIARTRHQPADPTEAETPTPPEPPTSPEEPGVIVRRSGDVMRVGSDIHVQQGEVVKGDVTALKGDVIVDGHVEGNVVSMFGDVYL